MRIAVLADIGQPVYHVGDEAIGQATARAFSQRGHEPVMLAFDPELAAPEYPGARVERTIAVPWNEAERLERYRAAAAGRFDDPETARLADIITQCDGVHIAGGGNLNSLYGWLLIERAIVGQLARHLGKPLTLSGQTVGPAASYAEAPVLAELFGLAQRAGVRDRESARLVSRLTGARPPRVGLDDASFLAPGEGSAGDPWISVTLSRDIALPHDSAVHEGFAELLAMLHARVGGPVVFQPHMQTPGSPDADFAVHEQIAERMPSGSFSLEQISSATEAAARYGSASCVVTSRFHPVVFGLSAAKPIFAFAPSYYSFSRMSGAFENWGLRGAVAGIDAVRDRRAIGAADALLADAEAISAHLRAASPRQRDVAANWWDALCSAHEGRTGASMVAFVPTWRKLPPVWTSLADSREALRRSQRAQQAEVDDRALDQLGVQSLPRGARVRRHAARWAARLQRAVRDPRGFIVKVISAAKGK